MPKYPDDISLQILHALRIGLCVKVEDGSISFKDATKLINSCSFFHAFQHQTCYYNQIFEFRPKGIFSFFIFFLKVEG